MTNDHLAKALKVLRSFNGAYDEYADGIEQMQSALKSVYKLAGGHATECQCRQCEIFELLEPIVGNSSPSNAHEPLEQRRPFAGLQSLSFDVSENPTIALVMRFDNIEHAQAARHQLWQPAGASRDASSEPK